MTELGWLLFIITLQSVGLLIAVLISVSFLIYFDRKVWAAVMMRRSRCATTRCGVGVAPVRPRSA